MFTRSRLGNDSSAWMHVFMFTLTGVMHTGCCAAYTCIACVQVARVTSVEEIDSVKLYKCIVDIGSGMTKQVMAGLKQHMAKDHLLHILVVVITNLKAAKLAGEVSEAMILAAQAPDPSISPQGEMVQVLQVPGEW